MLPGSTCNWSTAHGLCTLGRTWTFHKTMATRNTIKIFSRAGFISSTPPCAASSKQSGQDTKPQPQQLQSEQLKPADKEQRQPTPQQMQQPAVRSTPTTTMKQERDLLIPFLVAVSLALYALIAVLGFVDSLDVQQQEDWKF